MEDAAGQAEPRFVVPGADGRCARCDRWSPTRYLPTERDCCGVLLCAECHDEAVRRGRCTAGAVRSAAEIEAVGADNADDDGPPPVFRIDESLVTQALARATAQIPGGGEERPGQVVMALAVASAMENRKHLIVQAGTGTGKSLAYLVPAILMGAKTVVATATT